MRLLHYLEIENFKRFGEKQRIELDHPAVLIGPNNCGKTSAIQALALWSQAVKTWYDTRKDSSAKKRTSTSLNRLNIVAVPVQRTRFFWHNTHVRTGNQDIPLLITVGVAYQGQVVALQMSFRNQGNELVYCTPDMAIAGNLDFMRYAATCKVELLYPMSGLQTEEPLLQPGFIDELLGQGQTAQVLRNLCLMVLRQSKQDWEAVQKLMQRLFQIELSTPEETTRGKIELQYRQPGVKEQLDLSSSGRGFQQMLLIFAYLYSHKGSVLLVDEPDAHLEILRQKQVYTLLRDIANENGSQVVIVTHSEVLLNEALDKNLTLLLDGKADNLATKTGIRNSLEYFGAEHYVKARERGYVLYVEGSTDIDILRALADRLGHPVSKIWDERINSFYVQDNYASQNSDTSLEKAEGGFGLLPKKHFDGLRKLLPALKGLAILDSDKKNQSSKIEPPLTVSYWTRYEVENYFITPDLLRRYAASREPVEDLFAQESQASIEATLNELVLELVFDGIHADFILWQAAEPKTANLVWESKTAQRKLSTFAEEFFRRLGKVLQRPMLLKKGELHQLIAYVDPDTIPQEVKEKLNLLTPLFAHAQKLDE